MFIYISELTVSASGEFFVCMFHMLEGNSKWEGQSYWI